MDNESLSENCNSHNSIQSIPNENVTKLRIYVVCKESYKNGHLVGAWIDPTLEVKSIYQAINQILMSSPIPYAQEWMILNHEGFGLLNLESIVDIELIQKTAILIAKHGELALELFAFYGTNPSEVEEALAYRYQGIYEDELEFAIQHFDLCCNNAIPNALKAYIDYGAFQRDIFIDDYFAIQLGINAHVFLRN